MSAADTLAARRAAIASIEDEAEKKTNLQSEMVTLYQGAQYHLYLYQKFTDVRLVFAPEFDIAFFGGDPDNFTFPRYDLDMTLFRVYENGKPLAVEPATCRGRRPASGTTSRCLRQDTPARRSASTPWRTSSMLRDHSLPANLEIYGRIRNALEAYGKQGAEPERQAKDFFFGIENSLKSWNGQLKGLQDPATDEEEAAAEAALRSGGDGQRRSQRRGSAMPGMPSRRRGASCCPTTSSE